MKTIRAFVCLLCLLVAACHTDTAKPSVWSTEIAHLPGVWRVVPRPRRPHVVWSEMARARDPSAATWRQRPACRGDEAIVFSWGLRGGATIHGTLAGRGLTNAKVMVRLIGRGEDEFWPLWVWRPEAEESRATFTASVPQGGRWVGGVITISCQNPADASIEVARLSIEEVRPPQPRPNLILVTLDTFRADHLSCMNHESAPTPTLDSLASAGALFEQAVSTSQCTGPSHASMLTGLYCFAHGVYRNEDGLSPDATTLAEVLSSEGYRTVGAVSIAHLNPATSNLGQGFDVFLESQWPRLGGEPADVRTAEVLRTLQCASADDSPLFMWLHYFDPHTPYTPPDEYTHGCPRKVMPDVRYLRGMGSVAYDPARGLVNDPAGEVERYCGEILFLDHHLGELFAGLRVLGILEHAVVIVMADHGEGLGEHGIYFEHAGMFQEVLHVPLIISGAGVAAGGRVSVRASGVDVFPTMLARARSKSMPQNYGRDVLPLTTGTRRSHHAVIFAESVNRAICAAWKGDGKLVWIPDDKPQDWSVPERIMWFDIAQDPSEVNNLIAAHSNQAQRLKDEFDKAAARPVVSLRAHQGSADTDRLRALGYVE
ncbi:sulfatase [Candidatus Fermentibacteria bacterium]|nr:sulfatase [Candidatus Fermentibacteria bacterium]